MNEPKLLRVPKTYRSVSDVLGVAGKLTLPNVIVLSEQADGSLVFLSTEMNSAAANYLLDRTKALLITPSVFERQDT